ncbi:hypothetical protein B296_00004475 [Ensete ventricosum]|uniref:GDSL esterase/lipase n=1 Tax=Ensete ventricosum TaxID=4639 RepID=A0A427B5V1_ENSVE|nr:hypothetical protein B296_00004475 [Ensete ventricosum]
MVRAAGRSARLCSIPTGLLLLLPLLPATLPVEAACGSGAVVFNFGDSNSDTVGLTAGLGILLPQEEGRVFFRRSSGRLCDGRLVIDFLCESLNTSYLSPYMEPLGADFSNGANFAVAGSCTRPADVPFSLAVQVRQFLRFKLRSLELVAQGAEDLIDAEGFRNAIYTIDIGQNDLADAFSANLSYVQVVQRVPSVIHEIKQAIEASLGFETALMACCGYGGPPYNFNQSIDCGAFGSRVCPLGSKHISWDGVHYTEAANAIVASKILTTKYSKPNLAFDYSCTA